MFAASKTAAAAAGAPPASTDPQFNYVTLLLNDTGTNGAQNNTFLDSSTNNFTITRNGTPTQGSFSPYGDLWSNQFSGTVGNYLSISNSTALDLPADFTIEAWVYCTSTANALNTIVGKWSTPYAWVVAVNPSTGTLEFYYGNSGSYVGGSVLGTSFRPNTWMHVALSRSGSTVRGFINGQQVGTDQTITSNLSATASTFVGRDDSTVRYISGYISNVRIVKGTALYTSNFTPSTTPLTAVSGTSLLTCQSNRFKDNSSNNFAITVTGAPTVQSFDPFSPAASYGVSDGGSGYFGTSGQSVQAASNAAFAFGTGDFTVEYLVYATSWASSPTIVDLRSSNPSSGGYADYYSTAGKFNLYWATTTVYTSSATLGLNQWYHVAVSRSGSTVRVFVNGVLDGTFTNAFNFTDSNCRIGANTNTTPAGIVGYISNVRIVKGTAVYTSAFTPPTSPVTAITNTSLLLNFTNAGIYDAAVQNDLVTVGNAQVSTAVAKFGSSSMYFDGSGDYLTAPDNPIFTLGAGNWTIESWVYTGVSSGNQAIIGQCSSSGGANTGSFVLYASISGYPRIMVGVGSNWQWAQSSTLLPLNQWVHLAGVRNGATVTIYVNGVSSGTYSISTNTINDSAFSVAVGRTGEFNGEYLNGYIEDLRITKGYARYTSAFTPPTAPFPTR